MQVYTVDVAHPAADVVGAAAAALAATAQALAPDDPAYAARALAHARELYSFATLHPGTYLASLPEAATIYPSTSQNQARLRPMWQPLVRGATAHIIAPPPRGELSRAPGMPRPATSPQVASASCSQARSTAAPTPCPTRNRRAVPGPGMGGPHRGLGSPDLMSRRQGLAWAAAWLHGATGEAAYLADAGDYLAATQAFEGEKFAERVAFWDNLVWSTQLLLWTQTRSPVYQARAAAAAGRGPHCACEPAKRGRLQPLRPCERPWAFWHIGVALETMPR